MPHNLFEYHTMGAMAVGAKRFSFNLPSGKKWTLSNAENARAQAFFCGGNTSSGAQLPAPTPMPMTCPSVSQTLLDNATRQGQAMAGFKRFDVDRGWDSELQDMANSWVIANAGISVADMEKFPRECRQQYEMILNAIRVGYQNQVSKFPPIYYSA